MILKQIGEKSFTSLNNELHSFDGYYKNVILNNNNLIIPYINLGISNHEINPSQDLYFLNFAYLIFEKVNFLTVYINKKRLFIINRHHSDEIHNCGGAYLDYEKAVFNDMEICSEKSYLQTLKMSEISNKMWLPVDTPKYKINMNQNEVEQFYNYTFLPDHISALIL
jgi:hypothetical protein